MTYRPKAQRSPRSSVWFHSPSRWVVWTNTALDVNLAMEKQVEKPKPNMKCVLYITEHRVVTFIVWSNNFLQSLKEANYKLLEISIQVPPMIDCLFHLNKHKFWHCWWIWQFCTINFTSKIEIALEGHGRLLSPYTTWCREGTRLFFTMSHLCQIQYTVNKHCDPVCKKAMAHSRTCAYRT